MGLVAEEEVMDLVAEQEEMEKIKIICIHGQTSCDDNECGNGDINNVCNFQLILL
jgi:hypothetical protein